VAKHSPKRTAPLKNQKQPMGMPHTRHVLLKDMEIYELNNNEFFSFVRIAKTFKVVVHFHFLILVM
jgi:hypothetical protein